MEPTSNKPTRKMQAVGVSLPVSVFLVWLLQQAGVEMPAEVATALGSIIAFVFGYLTPDKAGQIARQAGAIVKKFRNGLETDDTNQEPPNDAG